MEIIICKYKGCGTTGHTAEEEPDLTVCHKPKQASRKWCYSKRQKKGNTQIYKQGGYCLWKPENNPSVLTQNFVRYWSLGRLLRSALGIPGWEISRWLKGSTGRGIRMNTGWESVMLVERGKDPQKLLDRKKGGLKSMREGHQNSFLQRVSSVTFLNGLL